ncbi:MAG TPA: hypothetical protein VKW76_06870 [Candidatus Binatia bacterium]|nr:hypothetical protein [Candidatus Binatia bacterium]
MSIPEVRAIMGEPTSVYTHVTGKVFVHFYFGDDAAEAVMMYKGVGRVITAGGIFWPPAVYRIECDPMENGYYRR